MSNLDEKIRLKTGGLGLSEENYTIVEKNSILSAKEDTLAYKNAVIEAYNNLTTQGNFRGGWNASTNSPALTATPSAANDYYEVTVAGTQSITGSSTAFVLGDRVKSNGTAWVKVAFSLGDGSVAQTKLETLLNVFLNYLKDSFDWSTTDNRIVIQDASGNISFDLGEDGILKLFALTAGAISAKTVNGIELTPEDDYYQILTDSLGNVASLETWDGKLKNAEVDTKILKVASKIGLEADVDGGLIIRNLLTNSIIFSISATGEIALSNLTINVDSQEQYPLSLQDADGNINFALDRNSNVITKKSIATNAKKGFRRNLNHIIGYGQSLSVLSATGAITTSQRSGYNSLMFSGGVGPVTWAGNQSANEVDVYAALTSLQEVTAESPYSGVSEMIQERIQSENGFAPDTGYRLLLSAPGNGGMSLAQLSKGTMHYNHLLKDVSYGLLRANASGLTYGVDGIIWIQGESNLSDANYKAPLIQLWKDLDADIKAITGQTTPVKLIMYQTNGFNAVSVTAGTITVAAQQLELAIDDNYPHIIMAGPTYPYPCQSDNTHLTPMSSKRMGAMLGLVWKRIFVDGVDWKPIYVVDSLRQGNIVELEFYAYTMPLQFDTTNVSNPGNFGFRLFAANGTEITITSVTLTRKGTAVKIVAASTVYAGSYMTYGYDTGTYPGSGPTTGTRGNLRDSQAITFDASGINTVVYNWCPLFKYTLQ
ncbi:sialate O-acetylesterase [Runella sp.]|uniref:sialate O-acetylesterase n=1 Tax=Runella sp. TaxID=1960881 RepID=UPI003D147FEC